MDSALERESKWEVGDRFVLPDLGATVNVGRVERSTVALESVYYDTAERDLLSHNITLRRRAGTDESDWQLTIPVDDGRLELRRPVSEDVPDEFATVLTGARPGRDLLPFATIHTTRERHRIHADDVVVAEVDADRVEAILGSGGPETRAWREIEVELGANPGETPGLIAEYLVDVGAEPATRPSKLARILPDLDAKPASGRAGRALWSYLNEQTAAIFASDVAIRRGTDPIHDPRVATRRPRSTLRVFGKQLAPARVGDVGDEPKWLASLLGHVRDCDVLRARFAKAIDDLPAELVLGPVAARLHRYAAELAANSHKRKAAKRTAKHHKTIQRVLGDHNDAVVAADTLWHTATETARIPDENGFTYGFLPAAEQRRAQDARAIVCRDQ